MSPPVSHTDFLTCVRHSRLLSDSVIAKVERHVSQHSRAGANPTKVAESLVRGKILTRFQARQLIRGRYDGFYIGNYKLLEVLGNGGMGRVYLAEQVRLHRLVALKVMRRARMSKTESTLARFTREAQAVAALRHANIIQAYDFDEFDGMPYIVMEFVEGIDLDRHVAKFGRIKWAQAADYIRQAAAGLQHAHEAGMVHRDLKPANLLVDLQGTVRLLDLGLVADNRDVSGTNDALTRDQDQLGTVDYVAPEQALDSHAADIRSDIYSLGAVLYSVTAGQIMFPGRSTAEKLLLHQTGEPKPINELAPEMPGQMCGVIRRMLAKSPDERYQTPAEVMDALRPFAEPIVPPFASSAIKYRIDDVSLFLRRSPPIEEIVSMHEQRSHAANPFDSGGITSDGSTRTRHDSRTSRRSHERKRSAGRGQARQTQSSKKKQRRNEDAKKTVRIGNLTLPLDRSRLIGAIGGVVLTFVGIAVVGPMFMSAAPVIPADIGQTSPAATAPSGAAPPVVTGPWGVQSIETAGEPKSITAGELPFVLYVESNLPDTPPYDPISGLMGDTDFITQQFDCTDNPFSGEHCLKIGFANTSGWGGVTWMNPPGGWGNVRGGFDLSVAKMLSFWARGERGGEQVEFKLGLTDSAQAYPDTGSAGLGTVTLTTEWQKYEISLEGVDVSEIKSGFVWVTKPSGSPVTFYIDDLLYE